MSKEERAKIGATICHHGATVHTTNLGTGEVTEARCEPDGYVVVTGPKMRVAHEQVYSNGTIIVTLKRVEND